ncbi:MAG: oligosaccharide flippase family protein [Ignavibacteriae bacterium]|nr:hypothetical protein [Ignavibacteriota bacterium]NOG99094.1 oligosaccharide flippase family protein [Ignavibacteriota bacterium]
MNSTKHIFWGVVDRILFAIVQFGLFLVLTRILTPKDFGVAAIVLIVLNFLDIFSQFGLPQALIQKEDINTAHISTSIAISFIIATILSLFLFLFSGNLQDFFEINDLSRTLKISSFILIVYSLKSVPEAILIRKYKFKHLTFINAISFTLSYGICGIIFAINGFKFYSIIFAHLIFTIFQVVLFLRFVKEEIFKLVNISFNAFKEIQSFAIFQTLSRVGNFIANEAENLIIGKMLGPLSLGYYNRSLKLTLMPINVLGQGLNNFFFPKFSRIRKNKILINDILLQLILFILSVSIPLSIYINQYSSEIIYVLLGEKWMVMQTYIGLLSFLIPLRSTSKMLDTFIRSIGKLKARSVVQWIYAADTIIFTTIGILYFKLIGAIWGVILASILNLILMTFLTFRITEVSLKEYFNKKFINLISVLTIQIASLSFIYYFFENFLIIEYMVLKFSLGLFILLISIFFFSRILFEKLLLTIEEE